MLNHCWTEVLWQSETSIAMLSVVGIVSYALNHFISSSVNQFLNERRRSFTVWSAETGYVRQSAVISTLSRLQCEQDTTYPTATLQFDQLDMKERGLRSLCSYKFI